jgi:toxin ParE1/3/4
MGPGPRAVGWTARALVDLNRALEDLAEQASGIEHALYDEVMAKAASLATLSERGRLVPELHDQRTREVFVRDYRLMYEVRDDRVDIVAFVFGRRDFQAWWRSRQIY